VEDVKEIVAHRLSVIVDGQALMAGNAKLMRMYGVKYNPRVDRLSEQVK